MTGFPLHPKEVNADHVIPLSRQDLDPSDAEDNIWIVDKRVNSMKGSMTYDELIDVCKDVINHHEKSLELLGRIQRREIQPCQKSDFDKWVEKNCDKDGLVKSE